ncbi:MAG TPA: hypothetical protein VK547_09630 [Candidatus Udaeobacter sp.]|nr:hypothetical protein [Candidatus Udaeobacter sp.]
MSRPDDRTPPVAAYAFPLIPSPPAAHVPWCETHIADESGFRACYSPGIDLDFPARDSRADACRTASVCAVDDSESGATVNVSLGGGQLHEITVPAARALAYALLANASRADGDEGAHGVYSDVSAGFAS